MALIFMSLLVPAMGHGEMVKPRTRVQLVRYGHSWFPRKRAGMREVEPGAFSQWGVCGEPFAEMDTTPTKWFQVVDVLEAGKEFDVWVDPWANHGGNAWLEFICTDGKEDLTAEDLKEKHAKEWETLKRPQSDAKYGKESLSFLAGYETEMYWPGRHADRQTKNVKMAQPDHFQGAASGQITRAKYLAPRKACKHGLLRWIWDAGDVDGGTPSCIPTGAGPRNNKEEPSKEEYSRRQGDYRWKTLPYCNELKKYTRAIDVQKPWQRTSGICPQTFTSCADIEIVIDIGSLALPVYFEPMPRCDPSKPCLIRNAKCIASDTKQECTQDSRDCFCRCEGGKCEEKEYSNGWVAAPELNSDIIPLLASCKGIVGGWEYRKGHGSNLCGQLRCCRKKVNSGFTCVPNQPCGTADARQHCPNLSNEEKCVCSRKGNACEKTAARSITSRTGSGSTTTESSSTSSGSGSTTSESGSASTGSGSTTSESGSASTGSVSTTTKSSSTSTGSGSTTTESRTSTGSSSTTTESGSTTTGSGSARTEDGDEGDNTILIIAVVGGFFLLGAVGAFAFKWSANKEERRTVVKKKHGSRGRVAVKPDSECRKRE